MCAFWREDMDPLVKAAVLSWWADELEDWSVDQVRWALRKRCRDEPNKRANPGHILRLLKQRRGQACAARMAQQRAAAGPPDPKAAPLSPEVCARRSEAIQSVLSGFAAARRV